MNLERKSQGSCIVFSLTLYKRNRITTGFVKLAKFEKIEPVINAFPLSRRTSPAARSQMIDSSACDNWPLEGDAVQRERGCEPDREQIGNVAPDQVI